MMNFTHIKKFFLISGSVLVPFIGMLLVLPVTWACKIADSEDLQREY